MTTRPDPADIDRILEVVDDDLRDLDPDEAQALAAEVVALRAELAEANETILSWRRDYAELQEHLRTAGAAREAAERALGRIRLNARSWHGPVTEDNRHAKALAVIAKWCDAALASAAAADTTEDTAS